MTIDTSRKATQEACQVSRQRFSVLRLERRAGSRVWKERDPVQKHHGMTVYSADAGQSPSVASLALGEASSDYVGQKEPLG